MSGNQKDVEEDRIRQKELLCSVFVPVYNKEECLQQCLECLDNQTLDHSCFEAIFIDDGSADNSLTYLEEQAVSRPWMRVIHQDNQGVSAARNAGILAAQGKYIFYLDPDDAFTANTLESVSAFFNAHYEEIDLVTYPIVPFKNGKRQKMHYRYNTLKVDGVYDLSSDTNCLICQTTMNIVVKNGLNQFFDFQTFNGVIFHEDEFYISKILCKKMAIGFCSDPAYYWQQNDSSVSASIVKPYYIWDNATYAYEDLFGRFNNEVPRYFQNLLANDLGWKMRCDAALPTHLQGTEYNQALERLARLINRVDDDVILKNPNMNSYHALFFIGLKQDTNIKACVGPGGISLLNKEKVLYSASKVELFITRTKCSSSGIVMSAFLKSPVF